MTLIETPEALQRLMNRLAGRPWIAVDTEFVRERTYFAQLCLVQIGDAEEQACIDALAVELSPLWDFLAQPDLTVVLHAASQDLELFAQHAGDCPRPLWDTQVAAALLGIGDQIGYAGLVKARLGLELDKSLSRTDWSKRPLTGPALTYAADDVRHLATMYPSLEADLAALGRTQWLEEDCQRLCDLDRYKPDPDSAWQRLRGLGRQSPPVQHRVAALARWREIEAVNRNRPRKWILPDDVLYAIAHANPGTREQLAGCGEIPPRLVERHGQALLDVLASIEADVEPLVLDDRPDAEHKAKVKALAERVRSEAEALNLPSSMLAPRAEIERLARDGDAAEALALTGWRREVIGRKLLEML